MSPLEKERANRVRERKQLLSTIATLTDALNRANRVLNGIAEAPPPKRPAPSSTLRRAASDSIDLDDGGLEAIIAAALATIAGQLAAFVQSRLVKGSLDQSDIAQIVAQIDFGPLEDLAPRIGDALAARAKIAASEMLDEIQFALPSEAERGLLKSVAFEAKSRAAELVGLKIGKAGRLEANPNANEAITASTTNMLVESLAVALAGGVVGSGIVAAIKSAYAFSRKRAAAIALTETQRASGMAGVEAMRVVNKSGGKILKSWRVREACCDECADNAAQGPIPVESRFNSGHLYSPAHPNCRCAITAMSTNRLSRRTSTAFDAAMAKVAELREGRDDMLERLNRLDSFADQLHRFSQLDDTPMPARCRH